MSRVVASLLRAITVLVGPVLSRTATANGDARWIAIRPGYIDRPVRHCRQLIGYGAWPTRPVTLVTAAIGVVLGSLILMTSLTRPAGAHDAAGWIMREPRYVDRGGVHCCGPADCHPISPADLYEDQDGVAWGGQRLKHGERGIYWVAEPDPPAEMRPWVCVRHGRLRCVFRRQPGS